MRIKYIATGHSIDLRLAFDNREEAEKQIEKWIQEDVEEFGGSAKDYQKEYYITEEKD